MIASQTSMSVMKDFITKLSLSLLPSVVAACSENCVHVSCACILCKSVPRKIDAGRGIGDDYRLDKVENDGHWGDLNAREEAGRYKSSGRWSGNDIKGWVNNERAPKNTYNIPESRSAFCKIVSLTAANTNRICIMSVETQKRGMDKLTLLVSVACVKCG
jgi:hypothetical protein